MKLKLFSSKNREERIPDAVKGLCDACATIYDTQNNGEWSSPKLAEKMKEKLLELGVKEADLNATSLTYPEFSQKVFNRIGLDSDYFSRANVIRYRVGLETARSMNLENIHWEMREHRDLIIRNDEYNDIRNKTLSSTKSGARIEISGEKAKFVLGPLKMYFPSELVEPLTGHKIPNQKTEEASNPNAENQKVKKPLPTDFVKLCKKFVNSGLGNYEFEKFMTGLFEKHGWEVTYRGGKWGPDGGIDGVIQKELELTGEHVTYIIQAKNYSEKNIGRPVVDQLLGSVMREKADGGIIATTSGFVRNLQENFQETEPYRIVFYDGETLKKMAEEVMNKGYTEIIPHKRSKEVRFKDYLTQAHTRCEKIREIASKRFNIQYYRSKQEELDRTAGELNIIMPKLINSLNQNSTIVEKYEKKIEGLIKEFNQIPKDERENLEINDSYRALVFLYK